MIIENDVSKNILILAIRKEEIKKIRIMSNMGMADGKLIIQGTEKTLKSVIPGFGEEKENNERKSAPESNQGKT